MSVTYFETAQRPQTLVAQVAAWFGAGQREQATSKRAPLARQAGRDERLAASARCGTAADTEGGQVIAFPAPAADPTADLAAQLRAAERRGQQMERAFAQYVSPQVLERLMANPEGLTLGGETRDVTILFADLRGFTAMAEVLKDNPRRLTDLINIFLDPMTDIVIAHGGTVDKYMGDCVMAFWGAPMDDPDHAQHAVDAGLAMLAAMDEVNRRLQAEFADEFDVPTVRIGIGINSGECLVGNLGSRRRFDYSVLGDPVNVASRLQGRCKTYDLPLLIGEETARRLPASEDLNIIDRIQLRGRSEELCVYAPE